MIEINLLPPQYRAVERTPLPIFLSIIGGLLLTGGALTGLFLASKAAQSAKELQENLVAERDTKKAQAAVVDQLEQEIKEAQGRVDTLLNIAESKIYWAMKLDQFVKILPPSVWLDSIVINSKGGTGEMKLVANARGTGFNRLAELKQALRNDTNFFYHFASVNAPTINIVAASSKYAEPEYLNFPTVTLPLKSDAPAPQPGKRK
jgi:Tfp pilus assembly protein PilN